MKHPSRVLFAVTAALTVGADLVTKWWAFARGPEPYVVVAGFFRLVQVKNPGAVGAILAGRRGILIAVTVVAIVFILTLWWRNANAGTWWTVALGLLFGGAVGNLYDRIRFGHVRDFLDFHLGESGWHYPAFNLADAALVVGAVMLFLWMWRRKEPGHTSEPN